MVTNMNATDVMDKRSSCTDTSTAIPTYTVSETASRNKTSLATRPRFFQWIEYPFRVKQPNTEGVILPEATGWAMDAAARGPLSNVGAILGNTLLVFASIDAGCTQISSCEATIYGLRPSSLLAAASSIVGVIAAVIMPIMGAIVDHTRHRKLVGTTSAALLVIITASQIFVTLENWFIILILEAIGGFTFIVHGAAVFAYLPDLSNDHEVMSYYTSKFNMRQYSTQVIFVSLTILVGLKLNTKGKTMIEINLELTRIALGMCVGLASIFLLYSWSFLFRKRNPLSMIPPGSTLVTASFNKNMKTFRQINSHYHSLKWFLISLLFSPEAGAGVMLAIVVTYFTIVLGVTGREIQQANLVFLLTNVFPGSHISHYMCKKFNPLNSYRLGLATMAIEFAIASIILTDPSRKNYIYLLCALWGASMGWTYPSQRVLFCTLIPKEQETEMMGIFTFTGQILGWVPVVIFTILNEKNVDMRWGMSLLGFFSIFALILTFPMNSFEQACKEVQNKSAITATIVTATIISNDNDNTLIHRQGQAVTAQKETSLDGKHCNDGDDDDFKDNGSVENESHLENTV